MKQIITGPSGRLAYHDADASMIWQYPTLNVPCRAFAAGAGVVAANSPHAPNIVYLPRHMRSRAALAMFGSPAKREI